MIKEKREKKKTEEWNGRSEKKEESVRININIEKPNPESQLLTSVNR